MDDNQSNPSLVASRGCNNSLKNIYPIYMQYISLMKKDFCLAIFELPMLNYCVNQGATFTFIFIAQLLDKTKKRVFTSPEKRILTSSETNISDMLVDT